MRERIVIQVALLQFFSKSAQAAENQKIILVRSLSRSLSSLEHICCMPPNFDR